MNNLREYYSIFHNQNESVNVIIFIIELIIEFQYFASFFIFSFPLLFFNFYFILLFL